MATWRSYTCLDRAYSCGNAAEPQCCSLFDAYAASLGLQPSSLNLTDVPAHYKSLQWCCPAAATHRCGNATFQCLSLITTPAPGTPVPPAGPVEDASAGGGGSTLIAIIAAVGAVAVIGVLLAIAAFRFLRLRKGPASDRAPTAAGQVLQAVVCCCDPRRYANGGAERRRTEGEAAEEMRRHHYRRHSDQSSSDSSVTPATRTPERTAQGAAFTGGLGRHDPTGGFDGIGPDDEGFAARHAGDLAFDIGTLHPSDFSDDSDDGADFGLDSSGSAARPERKGSFRHRTAPPPSLPEPAMGHEHRDTATVLQMLNLPASALPLPKQKPADSGTSSPVFSPTGTRPRLRSIIKSPTSGPLPAASPRNRKRASFHSLSFALASDAPADADDPPASTPPASKQASPRGDAAKMAAAAAEARGALHEQQLKDEATAAARAQEQGNAGQDDVEGGDGLGVASPMSAPDIEVQNATLTPRDIKATVHPSPPPEIAFGVDVVQSSGSDTDSPTPNPAADGAPRLQLPEQTPSLGHTPQTATPEPERDASRDTQEPRRESPARPSLSPLITRISPNPNASPDPAPAPGLLGLPSPLHGALSHSPGTTPRSGGAWRAEVQSTFALAAAVITSTAFPQGKDTISRNGPCTDDFKASDGARFAQPQHPTQCRVEVGEDLEHVWIPGGRLSVTPSPGPDVHGAMAPPPLQLPAPAAASPPTVAPTVSPAAVSPELGLPEGTMVKPPPMLRPAEPSSIDDAGLIGT